MIDQQSSGDFAPVLEPLTAGDIKLNSRVVQAPMGRLRADTQGQPTPIMVEHFTQRAGMGLIITDGTSPTPQGRVNKHQPGLYEDNQIDGWSQVAKSVHAQGGSIVTQLMHAGWNTHSSITNYPVESPSPVAHDGWTHDAHGQRIPYDIPIALDDEGIARVRTGFAKAAQRAYDAGLDGVELHAANGYLLHSFLSENSNTRDDHWGGTPFKRAQFVLSVAKAVSEKIPASRVGIRISPNINIQGVLADDEATTLETYGTLVEGLNELGIAYISLEDPTLNNPVSSMIRDTFTGALFGNFTIGSPTSMEREDVVRIITEGLADAAAVGRRAIANPDLVARWAQNGPVNDPDPTTFYTHGAQGYTMYPFLDE